MSLQSTVNTAVELLTQEQFLILNLNDDQYQASIDFIEPKGTVSEHMRHIINRYQSIIRAYKNEHHTINYEDKYSFKEENELFQQNKYYASKMISECKGDLNKMNVNQNFFMSDEGEYFKTNLQRELHQANDHTIHHNFTMKIILGYNGLILNKDFGVSPKTINNK